MIASLSGRTRKQGRADRPGPLPAAPVEAMHENQIPFVERNRAEYGEDYPLLNFVSAEQAAVGAAYRDALLARLAGQAAIGWKGSKIFTGPLSPGCRLCGDGRWSCLFVNGRCNCRCFYCPTAQDEIGLPTTNTVSFRTPAAYADYLQRFAFGGASLSGGEPLLTPGRTLGFLTAARNRLGPSAHLWLYTNGTLLDAATVARLRAAGLDEIRFDIGAVGYDLRKIALAVGHIPTVTVEIPAVPEEADRLRRLIVEMADLGVAHLNLHQLRLTPYSFPRFRGRPYTYLHGEKVTVLESELLALELLAESAEKGVPLPINYCSFVFKNRWQKVATRRRNGDFLRKGWEDLTESGLLRSLSLEGNAETLDRQKEKLRAAGAAERWALEKDGTLLSFAAELWPLLDFAGCRLRVSYAEAGQRAAVSYRNPFREVKLAGGEKFVVERWKIAETVLDEGEIAACASFFHSGEAVASVATEKGCQIAALEQVPAGLQDYF